MSDAYPVCPRCGAKETDPEALLGIEDDETLMDCWDCGQDYYITLHVKHTYATRPRTELDETREGLARSRNAERFWRQHIDELDLADNWRQRTEELERRVRELEARDG